MMHNAASLGRKAARAALALTALASWLVLFAHAGAQAQGFVRSPNLNIAPRVPSINTVPRVNPDLAGAVARTPNLHPACSYANREASGECSSGPVASTGGGGGSTGKGKTGKARRDVTQPSLDPQTIRNEIVAEIDSAQTDAQIEQLARRHGLARIASQNFALIGATIGLFRISNGRSVEAASRDFASDSNVHSVQPNFRHLLQQQAAALSEGDPAQYAVAKLRLPEAHALSRGANVIVAVIDSGVDASHPELANSVVDSFDALGSGEGPHVHGTGVAGAIAAHARLIGSAPAARILAIRAFGKGSSGTESNTFVVLKAMDYAAGHGARIINMSFAGPKDPLLERAIGALRAKDVVMVAAAGNAGAKSRPLYPAANPNVIAVSATDQQDHLFEPSNRGGYIALAAPGADIFLPAPDNKYQVTSGTSFSGAYVSGLAALMLERDPALKPDEVRAILQRTARDLGSPGRDDLFGAGEADAFAATEAAAAATPVAARESPKTGQSVPERNDEPLERSLTPPVATVASEKSANVRVNHPAKQ
jgi:hypothetical protein